MLGSAAAYLVKTSAVLALALLAAAAVRRRPAALRHFILSSALAGLLLLPLLSLLPVGWESPVLPRWMDASSWRGEGGAHDGAGRDAAAKTAGGPNLRVAEGAWKIAAPVGAGTGSGGSPSPSLPLLVVREPAPPVPSPDGSAAPLVPPTPAVRLLRDAAGLLVAAGWPAGAALLLLRLLAGLAGAVRLTRRGTPLADPAWRVLLERFAALVSLRRAVRLRAHPEVLVPLTWGWRRPVVLFPAGAGDWPVEERSAALLHELAHVKRADFLAMVLVRTSLALFWWNPLCWAVHREILKAQEIACDELVLRAGIRPSAYAASLLAFRRSAGFRWNPSAALLGLLGRSSFQERLAAILKHKIVLMEVKMKTKIVLAAVLVLTVALVGTARPVAGGGPAEAALVPLTQTVPPPPPPPPPDKKKEEKEKAKAQKVVVKAKEIGQGQVELVITEGGEVKKLRLDKPLTITRGEDGGALVLSVDGQDIEVLEGKSVRLEIKGGGLSVVRKGEPFVVRVDKKGDVGRDREGDEPAIAWTIKEGDGKHVWVAEGGRAFAIATAQEKEMLDKVRALQEQVAAVKAKKLDLSALEESLENLEAELEAKDEKLKEMTLKLDREPGEFKVVKGWVSGEGGPSQVAKAKEIIATAGKDEGAINLVFTDEKYEGGQAGFERAVAALQKALPEGYKLAEKTYDAEDGTMTFKVAAPEGKKTNETLIRKLVDSVKDALEIKK